jgi:hypothetical protein
MTKMLGVICNSVDDGGFSGEKYYELNLSSGDAYRDAAPEQYFSGTTMTVRGGEIKGTDTYAISVPSGSVVIVSSELVRS